MKKWLFKTCECIDKKHIYKFYKIANNYNKKTFIL